MTTKTYLIPALEPVYNRLHAYAEVGVRIAAGGFLIPHGAQKLFGMFGGYGLAATGEYFETNLGFSDGYLAALSAGSIELFGGLLLALGLFTRLSAGVIAVFLFVALTVHLPNGFMWTSSGFEYPLFWLIVVLSFVVKGGGELSLDRLIGKEI